MRIALVEDDLSQAELIRAWLADAGHACACFASGEQFRRHAEADAFDLVLLDWMLPDDDGLAILAWLKGVVGARYPVVMVTSRSEETAVVRALDAGAADYLPKPVKQAEMLARIRAIARRGDRGGPTNTICVGTVRLDRGERTATVDGEAITLSGKEFELAALFLENPGRLFTRKELLEEAWGAWAFADSRTLDTHLSRVRTKLGLNEARGIELLNVYGKGYRLEIRR